jgi:hypothetical protein
MATLFLLLAAIGSLMVGRSREPAMTRCDRAGVVVSAEPR